jgi:hypothetical protein
MWAAHGGLDFDGREHWDQWIKLKVKTLAHRPVIKLACNVSLSLSAADGCTCSARLPAQLGCSHQASNR